MNPIFTISNDKGLNGYWYDKFVSEFGNICEEHLENNRAKRFAFIIFDFHSETHSTLENQGVFTDLDRLSGKDITIFYLDGQRNEQKNKQNKLFKNLNTVVSELGNQNIQTIPFIIFFDFIDGDLENFKSYPIRDNEKFILNDLTTSVSKELLTLPKITDKKKKWDIFNLTKETPKIVYSEFIKLILKDIFETQQ